MFIKNKNTIVGTIIVLIILITVPILYINNKREDKVVDSNKDTIFRYQESYIKIGSYLEKHKDLSKQELEQLEPNKKLVESDGYYYIGSLYNEKTDKELRSITFKEENESVSVTYLYENNEPKEALSVQYYNTNVNGYINGIHSIYNKDSGYDLSFITNIGTISAEDQEKLVNYIKPNSKDNEAYKTYFRLAKIVQRSVSFPKEEFEKFDDDSVHYIGNNDTIVKVNNLQLIFMHDDNMEVIRGLKLIDEDGTLLYIKSFVGSSPIISGKGEVYTLTEITNDSFKSQNDLLDKLSKNIQESTPRTNGDDIINNNKNVRNIK